MLLYYLDLIGVAVFAASGVLAARDRQLDIFGMIIVATLTAIGGGTIRDLLLNRHPIFWIVDTWYLTTIIAATLVTILYLRWRPAPGFLFLIADALGLALFAMSGATLAFAANHAPMIVVIMGTMTGVAGGVLRDVITARVPLILQREIYATAAISGIVLYLALDYFTVAHDIAFWSGFGLIVVLRVLAMRGNLHLPVVRVA
ncbi:trimeric intracellular cation channel family protein [Candidatus Chloroploca sp. Khr17]|uniref:trimeric intracellular cation channel family protein n=1 Tax=Candidatus Chloroploca sp. Khr17 TaxID=2496869 RepID=UPI00101CA383|nr:trimeric intracellular cation channel family protein [Candidatus Chloroploca sp. Khr17]